MIEQLIACEVLIFEELDSREQSVEDLVIKQNRGDRVTFLSYFSPSPWNDSPPAIHIGRNVPRKPRYSAWPARELLVGWVAKPKHLEQRLEKHNPTLRISPRALFNTSVRSPHANTGLPEYEDAFFVFCFFMLYSFLLLDKFPPDIGQPIRTRVTQDQISVVVTGNTITSWAIFRDLRLHPRTRRYAEDARPSRDTARPCSR